MLAAAAGMLTALLLLLAAAAALARARWPARAPSYGLLLWQSLGFAGALLAVEAALTVALAPHGPTHASAVTALARGTGTPLPWWSWVGALVALALGLRLLSALLLLSVRTVQARRRHRALVDLVATRNPLLSRTRVVDHDVPLAYCLPGLRPRVVLSRGVLTLLREDELRAVLAHESAHVEQRHDLVVLPFVALDATLGWLSWVRVAQRRVALLVEMLADDRAARRHPRQVLARALYKIGSAPLPAGGLGMAGGVAADGVDGVLTRAGRLLSPQPCLTRSARLAVLTSSLLLVLTPALVLLLPAA